MIRNIIRTGASRWIVRRGLNLTPVIFRRLLAETTFKSSICTANRKFSSTPDNVQTDHIDQAVFEDICSETLESLCEYFEEIIDQTSHLKGADVTYSDGVLTVYLGPTHGTYVINRQTPNKQIWLSSPVSGPKRYDLVLKDGGFWIYKHDGIPLHRLLQDEISKIVDTVDFKSCAHSLV